MAGTTKDYYGILGVGRDASPDEIKRAFRRQARETHPDVAGHDGAEDSFKDLNEAYEVLSDPDKRAAYDRYGTTDPRAVGPDLGDVFGAGMDEIFSTLFGGGFGAYGGAGVRRARTEGRDMTVRTAISLEDAATGVEAEVRITRDGACETCGATGAAEGGQVVTCSDCGGTGVRRVQRRSFLGTLETAAACERCSQTGAVVDRPCPACAGTGRTRREESVRVTIPAGIRDGMSLRVAGMGEAGLRGALGGDLLVGIRVERHEYLHREGDDLHCRAAVGIAQAALGADIVVPGIWGDETVHVPAGSQHDDVVRVKGRGMPSVGGRADGDLLVHLAVRVPTKVNKRQRELLTELGEELGDQKRATVLERIRDWLSA